MAIANANRDHEPVYALQMRLIGQVHRYRPYERLPISTIGRLPNTRRAPAAQGCTTTPTSAADASVTIGSIHT